MDPPKERKKNPSMVASVRHGPSACPHVSADDLPYRERWGWERERAFPCLPFI